MHKSLAELDAGLQSVPISSSVDRRTAARDLLVVMLSIGVAWLGTKHILYPALGVPGNAPMVLRPILGFLVAWALLRMSRQNWSHFGLSRPRGLVGCLGVAIALYGVVYLATMVLVPFLGSVFPVRSEPVFLLYIRGNVAAYLGWLAIAWLVGGFIEELLFRGFLINRVESLFGNAPGSTAIAILAQAVLFGTLHLYQGAYGFVFAGTLAVLYGVAYVVLGRNLWPLIIVHGTWNSIAISRLYGL